MGGGASKTVLTDKQVQKYVKELGYSPSELEFLFNRFRYLCKSGDGELSRQDVAANTHLAGNKYVSRLYNVLPKNGHGCVTFDSFVRKAAVFRAEKPLDSKLDFIFDLFDYNMDDTLDPKELKEMIQLVSTRREQFALDVVVSGSGRFRLSQLSRSVHVANHFNADRRDCRLNRIFQKQKRTNSFRARYGPTHAIVSFHLFHAIPHNSWEITTNIRCSDGICLLQIKDILSKSSNP